MTSELRAPLLAVLFAAGDPLGADRLAAALEQPLDAVMAALEELADYLTRTDIGLSLRVVAGGYQLTTRAEYFPAVERLRQKPTGRLSAAVLETLSIIAFRQPVTRQEIESIRGVGSDRSIARLLELELISEVGRKDVVGRPILYATTERFLAVFGLAGLDDLPQLPHLAEPDAQQLSLLDGAAGEPAKPEQSATDG